MHYKYKNMENILFRKFIARNRLIFRIINLVIFSAFMAVETSIATESYQQSKGVTIVSNGTTISKVINVIERQTGYLFVYDANEVNLNIKINVYIRNKSVKEALNQVFKGTDIVYIVEGNNIMLKKKVIHKLEFNHASQSSDQARYSNKISGVVKDTYGQPVIGANVSIVGTVNGTITDSNGKFNLYDHSISGKLLVSYVGYESQEFSIKDKRYFSITLKEKSSNLNEVVVVAFGKEKREAFTGSAGIVDSKTILQSQQTDATEMLAGRVPGVQISNSSGQFGETPNILIRGFGSISADNSPLIVVDGMPYNGDMNNINPADIETMTVLKDAASNALYGARGANGVIMITTKRAKSGKSVITLDSKWGANSRAVQTYDCVTDPGEYYELYYKSLYNKDISDGMTAAQAHTQANYDVSSETSGLGPGYMVYTVPTGQDFIDANGKINSKATLGRMLTYNGEQYWLQPDNWQKAAFRTALRQEYNLSCSQASDKLNFFASLGYLKNEGISANSDMARLSGRLKADFQAKDWLKLGVNGSYAEYNYDKLSSDIDVVGAGTIWDVNMISPIYPLYIRDGNKNIVKDDWGKNLYDFGNSLGLTRPSFSGLNPVFSAKNIKNKTDGNSFTANTYADITLQKGLVLTINGSLTNDEYRWMYLESPYVQYYGTTQENGSLERSHSRNHSYNTEQLLNYTTTINNKHNLNILLGHEYYDTNFNYLYAHKTNLAFDDTEELNGGLTATGQESSYSSEYNNEGYFSRVMYDYLNKYYFSASYRRDASSRFSKSCRWGNFWSLGAAWLVSKEHFYHINWMNTLKLKMSIGSQGNDKVGDYLYADQYNIINNLGSAAFTFKQKGSSNITWETNINFNTGAEFELLNNRINGTVDFFYRKTKNMLFSISVPPSIGYASYYDNVGDMRNEGIEINLNADLIRTKDFAWLFNVNTTTIKNKILSLPSDKKTTIIDGHGGYTFDDSHFVSKYKFFLGEGLPIYSWYLPKYAGVNNEGLSMWYKNTSGAGRTTTTTYSEADSYLCGSAIPDLYGGFGTTFTYKGFDFSANFNYQIGGKAYDYGYSTIMAAPSEAYGGAFHKDLLKSWSSDNKKSNIPRFQYGDTYQNARSDRFLTNASFLNIQNVNLGYAIPTSMLGKSGISYLRFYMSCENVLYFSHRRGFDPRQSLMGYTNSATYTPIRTVSFGLSVKF